MEEQKHTPGPWKFNTAYDTIENDNGHVIVQFADWGWGNKGKLANAELIAQAPDLLAKVSEQEKEIENKNGRIKRLDSENWRLIEELDKTDRKVSEQSQRIQQLEGLLKRAMKVLGGWKTDAEWKLTDEIKAALNL